MKASLQLAHALATPLTAAAPTLAQGGQAFSATLQRLIPIPLHGEALPAGQVMTLQVTTMPGGGRSKPMTASLTGLAPPRIYQAAGALPGESKAMQPVPSSMPVAPANASTETDLPGALGTSHAGNEGLTHVPDSPRLPKVQVGSLEPSNLEVSVKRLPQSAASDGHGDLKKKKTEDPKHESETAQDKKAVPASESPLMPLASLAVPVIAVPTSVIQFTQASDAIPAAKIRNGGARGSVLPPSGLHATSDSIPMLQVSGSGNQEAVLYLVVPPTPGTMPAAASRATAPPSHVAPASIENKPENAPAPKDDRPGKDWAKTSVVDGKDWMVRSESAPLNQILTMVQHVATQNAATPAQELQKHGESHFLQASALQVLQRMDAPTTSAPVQLHADARQLHVGVASAALGWVEVRATSGPEGRVDAALHVQSDASAHVLEAHSKEISSFAHEHSVALGQISVGVGTGDSEGGDSRPTYSGTQEQTRSQEQERARPLRSTKQEYHAADRVTLISVRA